MSCEGSDANYQQHPLGCSTNSGLVGWERNTILRLDLELRGRRLLEIQKEDNHRTVAQNITILNGQDWDLNFFLVDRSAAIRFLHAFQNQSCSVALMLARDRRSTPEETVQACRDKYRAYDYFLRLMQQPGENKALAQEWVRAEEFTPGENGFLNWPRPAGGENKFLPIEKPEVFWICQLMANIQALRVSREGLPAHGYPTSLSCDLHWDNFTDLINNARNIKDLAVQIAMRTVDILRENEISDEQISSLLLKSYDPYRFMAEFGHLDRVCLGVWSQLLKTCGQSEFNQQLRQQLEEGFYAKVHLYKQRARLV